jgi:hypothetical protein
VWFLGQYSRNSFLHGTWTVPIFAEINTFCYQSISISFLHSVTGIWPSKYRKINEEELIHFMKDKKFCKYFTHLLFLLPKWWHEHLIQANPFTKATKYITTQILYIWSMPKQNLILMLITWILYIDVQICIPWASESRRQRSRRETAR